MSLLGKSRCLQTMSVGFLAGRAVTKPHEWGCGTVGSIVSGVEVAVFSFV